MATKTFKIGLSDTDKANMTQDIYEDVLSSMFGAYDSGKTYNTGDYVVYSNALYVCNADGTTGTWNSSKWDSANIEDLLTNYVPETRKIAGIDLQDDITKSELNGALGTVTSDNDQLSDNNGDVFPYIKSYSLPPKGISAGNLISAKSLFNKGNVLNIGNMTYGAYVQYSNGNVTANKEWCYSEHINIGSNVSFKCTYYTFYMIAFFSEDGTYISGYYKQALDTAIRYTPSNCAYMIFSTSKATLREGKLFIGGSYMESSVTDDAQVKLEKNVQINDDNLEVQTLKANKLAFSKLITTKGNVLDREKVVFNGQVYSASTGNLDSSNTGLNNWGHSEFIEIGANINFVVNCFCILCYYTSNKTFISGEIRTAETAGAQLQTPSTCKYVTMSYSYANYDLAMLYIGSSYPENYENAEYVLEIETKGDETNKWAGKKWICVGDSLTAIGTATTKYYYEYIEEKTGISVTNFGESGTGYINGGSDNFYNRVANIPTDGDVITIFGSFNDVKDNIHTLGSPTDTGTTTICGCINETLDRILSIYLTANKVPVIGVVSPTPWNYASLLPGNTNAENYVDALKQCCERKSIPFLDIFHNSNLHPDNSTFRSLVYSNDGDASWGVHPNAIGHKLIASHFYSLLDKLII